MPITSPTIITYIYLIIQDAAPIVSYALVIQILESFKLIRVYRTKIGFYKPSWLIVKNLD